MNKPRFNLPQYRGGNNNPNPAGMVAPDNSMRAVYNTVGKKDGFLSTQGFLRLERNITPGAAMNNIQFDLLENVTRNSGQTFPTEQRLVQADQFTVLRIGFFIGTYDTKKETRSSMDLATWANPNVFNGVNEAQGLRQIYSGFLSVQIGVTQYVRQQRMTAFLRRPITQGGVAVSTVAGQGVIPSDSWTDSNYGWINYVPTFELQGIQNYTIQVQLNNDAAAFGTPSGDRQDVAILMFEGIYHARLENGSKKAR